MRREVITLRHGDGVIVHVNPDLDACACVALAGVDPRDVHFLPAGALAIPQICPCCGVHLTGRERVLDHPLGEKGRLESNGMRHAAACSMPEARFADPKLLDEVDEQDSTGLVKEPRFSLAQVVAAVKRDLSAQGYRDAEHNRLTVELMGFVFRGLNLLHADRRAAETIVETILIVEVAGYRFAVPPQAVGTQVSFALAERGVCGSVYHDGWNLGISRFAGFYAPDLRLLEPHLPGWFVHSAGFLAAWGTRKSPQTCYPPRGTPQTQQELVALLRKVFEVEQ